MTFSGGNLPPTKGFWSLTLYDSQHSLYENSAKRYAIGLKDQNLRYNADGSLTIYISHDSPPAGWETNWLPAPRQEFSLYLRAYWPDAAILTGNWTPPAVQQREPNPSVANTSLANTLSAAQVQPAPVFTAASASPKSIHPVSSRRFAIRRSVRVARR